MLLIYHVWSLFNAGKCFTKIILLVHCNNQNSSTQKPVYYHVSPIVSFNKLPWLPRTTTLEIGITQSERLGVTKCGMWEIGGHKMWDVGEWGHKMWDVGEWGHKMWDVGDWGSQNVEFGRLGK